MLRLVGQVDAHTGQHIMNEVILGMLKGKTIVLPCHALSFLSHADWIISLEQGRIAEQGTFRGLLEAGGDFTRLMDEHASVTDAAEPEAAGAESVDVDVAQKDPKAAAVADEKGPKEGRDGKLMEVEERVRGAVDKTAFRYYLSEVGAGILFVAVVFIVGTITVVFQDW